MLVASLQQAWRSFWTLQKRRTEPAWARLLIAGAIAIGGALVLLLLAGILTGSVGDANWWRWWPKYLFLICLSVAYAILALCRALELLLPAAVIHQLSPARDWRAALFLNFVLVAGILGGYLVALQLIGWWFAYPSWMKASYPLAVTRFLAFVALMLAASWIGGRVRKKQRLLQYQVMESRLRMLQAQIEPHFLFNTLANVQSLIDYDPARAKRMLAGFTDHLRASLPGRPGPGCPPASVTATR
ncbi:histidine kinase [Pseudoduganella sp. HUAS MS19]